MMHRLVRTTPRHAACAGSAAIEFALILPLLISLLFGMVELANAIVLQERAKRTAHGLASAIAEAKITSTRDLTQLALALSDMMWPYQQSVSMAISGVVDASAPPFPCNSMPNRPCIMWQLPYGSDAQSHIGGAGGPAVMPGRLQFFPGQNYIVAETWVRYAPLFTFTATIIPTLKRQTFYGYAVYKAPMDANMQMQP